MVKHLVMWKLKEKGEAGQTAAARMKTAIEALSSVIPEIKEIEVGINFGRSDQASDVSLYSVFANEADLQTYLKHPAHLEVVQMVRELVSERRVVDYLAE